MRLFSIFAAVLAFPVAAWAADSQPSGSSRPGAERPNILLIVADDLGYGDVGFNGGREIPTPALDSLAAGGIQFVNGYVSCPVCSPTRAGLMTGRYQQRFGHEFNPGPNRQRQSDGPFGLPLTEVTVADRLKAAGYRTGLVGKWHLGHGEHHPNRRGFDEFYGFLGGAHPYFVEKNEGPNAILRNQEVVEAPEYLTDAFTHEALAFIDRHRSEPFFLYLAYNAVHGPLQAPPKYRDRVKHIEDEQRRTYAAMVTALDDGVGAVMGRLRELGLERRTLVFFISDNGGPRVTPASNLPLNGHKGTMYEGGVRVPFVMHWPGVLPAGEVYGHPVISLDIYPTALAAAGATPPEGVKLEGVNLLPFLGKLGRGVPHEALFWRQGERYAVRKAEWKLVVQQGRPELYNLAQDIGEKRDLSLEKPEKVQELQKAWQEWNASNVEPLWKATPRNRARRAR